MKTLFGLLISFSFLRAQAPITLGFSPMATPGVVTVAMNTAAIWPAYGITTPTTKTINEFCVYVSAVNGTPGTNFTMDLYSDTGGTPNASIDGPRTVSASLAGGVGFYCFTGLTTALTAGVQYWAVLKNTAGTPGSNNMTVRNTNTGTGQAGVGTSSIFGWVRKQSSDSGATWTAATVSNIMGPRWKFSDGSYGGLPVTQTTQSGISTGVYSAREAGNLFTLPAGPGTYNVIGAACNIATTGTPTGALRYRLYTGATTTPTLLATSGTAALANVAAGGTFMPLYFASTQAIAAGTAVRLVVGETTQSDANTARYDIWLYTVDSGAASKALTPFGGTKNTYTTDGTTFTDTDTIFSPCNLILDPATPFTASVGGGQRVYPIQ